MFDGADQATSWRRAAPVQPRAGAAALKAACRALQASRTPLMVIGSQALTRAEDAHKVADAVSRLGIPVYLSGMARGLLGPDHPMQMRHQRRQALREADCVVLCGVPCDFRLDYGRHVRRSAMLIAANRSAKEARMNRRPDVAAIGDAGAFLQDLAQALPGTGRQAWLDTLRARDAEREREIDSQVADRGPHVNPVALLREVERVAGDGALFVADGGDFVATAAYVLHPRAPLRWLDPGAFGTLGVGAGFAIGAAACEPSAEIWMILGDGACGYGLAEFDTLVRHGIPVIALVGNDAGWTQIAREQVKMLGDDVGTVLAHTAYHEVARGFGAQGILVQQWAQVPDALAEARRLASTGTPVLINVWLDKTAFREGSISM